MIELLKRVFCVAEAPIGLITLGVREKAQEDQNTILNKLFTNKEVSKKSYAFANSHNPINKIY